MTKSKLQQAGLAAVISAFIIGAAVSLAFVAGDGGGESPTTVAGEAPDTVAYANYQTPEELLAGHAGRPLIINFFASWCAPCRAELPDLAAAHDRYRDQVDFVGVDYQEVSEAAAAQLLHENGIEYPIMEDQDGDLLRELGTLPTMPTTIFVTADGEILERHHGLILAQQLNERIEELIAAS
ncbi:MAG: TlpA family protein disulfide reductase [Acidimicrobiia bacterium]